MIEFATQPFDVGNQAGRGHRARGVSLARPFTMMRSGPTMVTAAGPGCAQPLLHPDRCTTFELPTRARAARATSGASCRVGSFAEAHAGVPAQATTWRRGSLASTMNPSLAADAHRSFADVCDRPMAKSERPGAGRIPLAPR